MTAEVTLELRGGNAELWDARDREILAEGPRGTGKTRTILELIDALCRRFEGLSVLIARKYQRTLTTTSLKTFREQVLPSRGGVAFFGGSESEPASYRYSNGSNIIVGGMDNPEKVKSSEYDLIYVNEGTELTEEDYESLLPLLRHVRNGEPVIQAQRIVVDCNPANAGHWLNQRAERGDMRRIKTRIIDNPLMADRDGNLTEYGEQYISGMKVHGARRASWIDGEWAGVENACYPMFDRTVHMRPLEPGLHFKATIIWQDYGGDHSCSVGALSIDQFNRRWARECWGEPDQDEGKKLNQIISQFKERYRTTRGRGDPNQKYLNDRHGFSTAKGGNGGAQGPPRLHRVELCQPLWYTFPGGRVPTFREERNLMVPQGPFAEPDSPGIFLVEGAPGMEQLADQIEGYHFIFNETPKGITKDVYRVDEDHVAGLEYANEEWEEGTAGQIPTSARMGSRPQRNKMPGWRSV